MIIHFIKEIIVIQLNMLHSICFTPSRLLVQTWRTVLTSGINQEIQTLFQLFPDVCQKLAISRPLCNRDKWRLGPFCHHWPCDGPMWGKRASKAKTNLIGLCAVDWSY